MPARCGLLLLLALLAALAAACGGDDEPSDPLLRALRDGGVTVVIRHTRADERITEAEVLGDCARQRNLTLEGRAQAERIGEEFAALDLPLGEVRASPMCRTLETARLAFGDVTADRTLVSPGVIGTIEDDERRTRRLREQVAAGTAGRVDVLVTHTGNIGNAFDESVDEGESLVIARGSGGRVLGRVPADGWARLAE